MSRISTEPAVTYFCPVCGMTWASTLARMAAAAGEPCLLCGGGLVRGDELQAPKAGPLRSTQSVP